jgi:phage baseplate assembly protein W
MKTQHLVAEVFTNLASIEPRVELLSVLLQNAYGSRMIAPVAQVGRSER